MVTFPYDDIDKWINKDNAETSLEKYRKLLSNWKKGLRILKEVENTQFIKELKDVSFAFYYNVVSFINQYNYYSGRIDVSSFKKTELKSLLGLYKIASSNSSIGFEASNHYMYTQNLFLEKLVALKQIK